MSTVNWGKVGRDIGEEGTPFIDITKDPKAPGEFLIRGGRPGWSAEKICFNPPISTSQLNEKSSGPVVEILRVSDEWIRSPQGLLLNKFLVFGPDNRMVVRK